MNFKSRQEQREKGGEGFLVHESDAIKVIFTVDAFFGNGNGKARSGDGFCKEVTFISKTRVPTSSTLD